MIVRAVFTPVFGRSRLGGCGLLLQLFLLFHPPASHFLLRAQGFDLEPCCGKTVERCTYTVKNHPSGKVCQADLYICGGEIVAGDILCTGEGGFIAPLAFPKDA